MKKKRSLCLLLILSLLFNTLILVQANVDDTSNDLSLAIPYEGAEYDEDGYILSPSELNSDLPESTYNETMDALESEEIAAYSTQDDEMGEIEYHSEDEEAIDISDSVSIESNEDINYVPDYAKSTDSTEFYGYDDGTITSSEESLTDENVQQKETENDENIDNEEETEINDSEEVIVDDEDNIGDSLQSNLAPSSDESDEGSYTYPRKGDFSNLRYWGTVTADKSKVSITIHVLEKALTSASCTLIFYDVNNKYIERNKVSTGRLSVGSHTLTCNVPVHATVQEKINVNTIG